MEIVVISVLIINAVISWVLTGKYFKHKREIDERNEIIERLNMDNYVLKLRLDDLADSLGLCASDRDTLLRQLRRYKKFYGDLPETNIS